jgi:fumarate reductase flavoprotein subunit
VATDVDVIVAGAGAGGVVTALRAVAVGASVLLVDSSETYPRGSNTAMSTSMIPAGGSRWQFAQGIEDSPDVFRQDVRRKTNGTADETVLQALTQVAPELVSWLEDDCGVPLELVTEFRYPGHTRDRCHAVEDRAGRTLLRHLTTALQQHDDVTFIAPLRLEDVLLDGARGVVGARLVAPDGSTEEVSCRGGVVLATNGYGADPELVRRFAPEIADGLYHGGDGSRGDALRIGERLGAGTAQLDSYQGHGALATPHNVLLTWATVMHGGVIVNVRGERFDDETIGYSEFGARVLAQPGHVAWVVFDGRIDAACQPFADYQDLLSQGAVRWADGVEDLAGLIGAPTETLSRTLATADLAARGEAPDPFLRTDFAAGLQPPYAAVRVTGALFHTQGGLRIDGDARVLTGDLEPIPGLYAVGGAAVGISGRGASGYLAGNGLLAALGLGYLAGERVALDSAARV